MATQLNFAQQMDAVLKTLGDARPRLLLHACCGPCSSAAAGVEQKARAGIAKPRQHGVHLLGIVALCCHWYHPLL